MPASFSRPVGAQADVKELEYIAALHQTCMPGLRDNATVSSLDVIRLIKSRYDLRVPHSHGIRIVRGLGGGKVGADVIEKILDSQKVIEDEEELLKPKAKGNFLSTLKKTVTKRTSRRALDSKKEASQKELDSNTGDSMEKTASARKSQTELDGKKDDSGSEEQDKNDKETNLDTGVASTTFDPEYQQEDSEDPFDMESDEQEEYLDLVQILAILLMPSLAKAGKEWHDARTLKEEEPEPEPPVYKGITGLFLKCKDKRRDRIEAKAEALHQSLRPKPHDTLLHDVFQMLLAHANVEEGTPLDANLVKKLLLAGGEYERAHDAVLIDKMVEAACSPSGVFDEEAFVHALTDDLAGYKVGCEDQQQTPMFDVWGFESWREKALVDSEDEEREKAAAIEASSGAVDSTTLEPEVSTDAAEPAHDVENVEVSNAMDEKTDEVAKNQSTKTAPLDKIDNEKYIYDRPRSYMDIDYAVDSHSSVFLTVAIFVFFFFTSVVYSTLIRQHETFQPNCDPNFGCQLAATIVTWVIFACILVAAGFVVVIPLSIGNNPAERSPRRLAIAFLVSGILTWIPFVGVNAGQKNAEPPYSSFEATVTQPRFDAVQWLVLIVGIIVSFGLFVQFVLALIGNRRIRASNFLRRWCSTSNVRGSTRTKKAATRKLHAMLLNAHRLHPKHTAQLKGKAASDETMLNFVLRGERMEECGGIRWTWKKLLNKSLLNEEGVWITSRLIIIQTAQLFVIAIWIFLTWLLIERSAQAADEAQATLTDDLPDWVIGIVPTSKQVRGALYPAMGVMIMLMSIIFSVYLPSYTGTLLQFRSGVRPALKSPEFLRYRAAVDAVYMNIGNAIYGMVGAGFLFFAIIGLIIFLFIWDFSSDFMMLVLAWGLGLCITIALKVFITKTCRRHFYAGFLRLEPKKANLSSLALECWFIGLGGGVLVGRFTQFLLAACFFVGRTDVPFLSADVCLFGYTFDYVPTNFVKDILVHDAHRHPYTDRLITMYMMKLKNNKFCSDAGACWRQLFVVVLMPWLLRYRVFSDARLAEAQQAYNDRRRERGPSETSESFFKLDGHVVEDTVDAAAGGVKAFLGGSINEEGTAKPEVLYK